MSYRPRGRGRGRGRGHNMTWINPNLQSAAVRIEQPTASSTSFSFSKPNDNATQNIISAASRSVFASQNGRTNNGSSDMQEDNELPETENTQTTNTSMISINEGVFSDDSGFSRIPSKSLPGNKYMEVNLTCYI
jgi:hypothetical protein